MAYKSKKESAPVFVLTPKTGRHYILSYFNKPTRSVYHEHGAPGFKPSAIPLQVPIQYVYTFPLEWKEFMSVKEAKERELDIYLTFSLQTETAEDEKDPNKNKDCIVIRKENDVWWLFDKETHPVVVPIITDDGSDVLLILEYALKIDDAIMCVTKQKSFLKFAELQIMQAFGSIGRASTFKDALKMDQKFKDNREQIINDLNEHKFKGYGFTLLDLMFVTIVVSKRSVSRLEAAEKEEESKNDAAIIKIRKEAEASGIKMLAEAEATRIEKTGGAEAAILKQKLGHLLWYKQEKAKVIDGTTAEATFNLSHTTGSITLLGGNQLGLENDAELEKMLLANSIQTNNERTQKN